MDIIVSMHQNQGRREYQQDAMSIKKFPSIGVLSILADGMGGYEGGEIASKLVSENFRDFSIDGDIGESLKKYLLKGNASIKDYKEDHPNVKSMGTTAIAFFMTDKSCQWVSVGDSPLYVIRNRSTITRINENHSVAGLLDLQVKKGEISQEEALSSGQRHMLTSAVSGEDIPQIEVSTPWPVKEDDIFILASDGIETITEERIKEIVVGLTASGVTQENVQKACEALVEDVLDQKTRNQDNVTVIILANLRDNEPRTAIYNGIDLDFKKKQMASPQSITIGILALILFGVLIWFFYSSEKKDLKPTLQIIRTEVPSKSNVPKSTEIENTRVSKKENNKKVEDNKSSINDENTTLEHNAKEKNLIIHTKDVSEKEIKAQDKKIKRTGGV